MDLNKVKALWFLLALHPAGGPYHMTIDEEFSGEYRLFVKLAELQKVTIHSDYDYTRKEWVTVWQGEITQTDINRVILGLFSSDPEAMERVYDQA